MRLGTLQEESVYWYGRVEACGSGLLWHWLNFSTAWCTMRLNSVYKDWKHVLTQNVVTLNTCCDIACLTFQLPHTSQPVLSRATDDNPQLALFRASNVWNQRLKERNKPSARWKCFAIHKLVRWHFQVGWVSTLQFVFWDDINNQKYVWIIQLKWLFWISHGTVATSDRWGGQICSISCQIFSGFNVPKITEIG